MRSGLHILGCRYPKPLKLVHFVENPHWFKQLTRNVSHVDISCVLERNVWEAAIAARHSLHGGPPNLNDRSPSTRYYTPTAEYDNSPAEETTKPGRI